MQHFWYLGVTEPLDPGICDFEETNSCKYFYNSTNASEYQWIRRVGMLQSGIFGPNNDAYGKINGYFMFADSFNGKPGDAALLSFAEFNILRKSSSLRFAYMIFGDGTTLNILTQTSNNIRLNLWTKTGHQNYYWMKDCVHLPSYTNQNIIFVANNNVTDSGIYGYIALDNVYVEGSDCPDIDVQCDFEDEDFLCGYLNFTQWSMGNEWMVVSYNSKIDTATLNVDAGKFLWSISDRNLTYMISPELEVNAPSCVTFQYYANTTNRHTFALGIQFILENIDGSFTFPIAWVTVSVTDDKWELGQFDINENHAGIRLMIGNVLGQVGLDNIRVSQGQCKGHTCQGQFQCGNYCIDPSKVCDCVFDCPDRSDEALCYPKSKKMCESTDLYQLVCPHVWGKMVSLDKGQSFLARFQDSALLVVELGHNCSNFTTDLNKIVGDVYFQASQLKEELEYCADVTFRKLFCDSFVTYNITYADDLEIPYFKGLDIFFTDEIEQCTMKFQNFLNLKKHRINRDNMIFFLLNMTSCWEHLSFTNQQVIIISLQDNHIDTPVLFEGRMLSGMSQRYHQLIILTLVEESCIKPFYHLGHTYDYVAGWMDERD
ncbi:Hypothetical predicted protein [Mytilus galloprovincialis]|uniref:MAM domain-containing protein n=1 Tax=Mytilus galloprovincialis TaxID=29158 RepID=A0A8B6C1C3_MYTGA|nr:Hypothetical predicted protein [Mytilus galloprovincialis]